MGFEMKGGERDREKERKRERFISTNVHVLPLKR
jgi:hypothetical protein